MTITIDPDLGARLIERADAQGLTIPAYVERLLIADRSAEQELECLALEGSDSGEPVEPGPMYWQEKHRRLEERLRQTGKR